MFTLIFLRRKEAVFDRILATICLIQRRGYDELSVVQFNYPFKLARESGMPQKARENIDRVNLLYKYNA